MFKNKSVKKTLKRLVSLLLTLTVTAGLFVTLDFSVSAEVQAATGDDIYALLYKYVDSNGLESSNMYELVFQNSNAKDPEKTYVKEYSGFADTDKTQADSKNAAWSSYRGSIKRVDIRDRIAPMSIDGWFYGMKQLKNSELLHLENLDTSSCKYMRYTFAESGIDTLDLRSFDVSNVVSAFAAFFNCPSLTELDISNWTLSNVGSDESGNLESFLQATALETIDLSSLDLQYSFNLRSMLKGNTKLKSVIFGNKFTIGEKTKTNMIINLYQMFEGCTALETLDLSSWNVCRTQNCGRMFVNCSALTDVNFDGGTWSATAGNSTYTSAFQGCASLETFKPSFMTSNLRSGSIFNGCEGLKELDLSSIGTAAELKPSTPKSDLRTAANIYEGCNELCRITLNENYPASGKGGSSVPAKQTWARIKNADGSDYTGAKQILTATQLFLEFKTEYAGTWVAVDKIVLNSNGGVTEQQSIDGAKDMELEYDPSDIVDPERVGYDFDDWYSEKEDGKGVKLEPGTIAQSWAYYAHWIPHTYTLIVNGNDGTVPEGAEVNGGVISPDRTTITYSNITYPEFVELNNSMFTRSGAYQLTGWNTRANGQGNGYAANDSVNKLTPTDKDTVTLFAQWTESDYVITFDSQGGSAVNKQYYDLNEKYGTLPTPEKTASTFLGWYTEAEGGTQITSTTVVDGDKILYAHWKDDPKVYFHPNGSGAQLDGSTDVQFKVYNVGQKLGVLPVPDWGTRTFKGWYEDATAETAGTLATSTTVVNDDVHYYAHWGYKPVFETDGGNFTSYDASNYTIKSDPSYTMSVLPTATKPNHNFDGWYFQYTEDGVAKEQKLEIDQQTGKTPAIDLTKGTVIRAKWTPSAEVLTITFNADGGSSSRSSTKVYAGHQIGELPSASRDGYEFLGWFRDGAAQPDTIESTYSANTALTARWLEQDITLNFDANGGTIVGSPIVSLPSGHCVSSLPGANRKDYSLEGWYPLDSNNELDLTKKLTTSTAITQSTTYYANWVDNELANARYKYAIQWDTQSNTEVTNTGDTLVFHPTVSGYISGHIHIHFRHDDYPIEKGKAVITVPEFIFKDKNGNGIGENNITADSDFAVDRDGNGNMIITNKEKLKLNFDLEYHYYNVNPILLEGYTDSNNVYHPDHYQNGFDVKMDITDSSDDTYSIHYTKHLSLEFHSDAAVSAEKAQSSVSLNWDTKWGTTVPADAGEYFYVTWTLTGKVSNCTHSYDIKWSEDTVHDGTVIYYENLESWKTNQSGGTYTAKVVTKHRRDAATQGTNWRNVYNEAILTVKYKSGEIVAKRVSAAAGAYIEPQTSGTDGFTKTIKNYSVQGNHKKWGNAQDYIINGYYPNNESLNLFPYVTTYKGEVQSDAVWNSATGTYSVNKRTISISDGSKGDVILSSASGADKYKWNSSTNHALGIGDYIFTDLKITLTEYDAVCMDGKWSNPFVHSAVSDYEKVIVRVRTSLNSNLEVCYTGIGSGTHNVTLPDGTYYYEVEHPSAFYKTDMSVEANMSLVFSNKLKSYVSEDVGNGWDTLIKNNSTLKITSGGSTQTVQSKDASQNNEAWPSIYQFGRSTTSLYAGKQCAECTAENMQPETSTEKFPFVIAGWTYSNGEMKKVVSSGVFYDLLPVECTVDPDSVFVKTRFSSAAVTSLSVTAASYENQKNSGVVLDSGYYSVSFEENYQGSGRTMMIIQINSPEYDDWDYDYKPVGYNVFYKMKTTFSNIHANGQNLLNSVAFMDTTLNQAKPENRYATTKILDVKTKPYLLSVDSDQTAFAAATTLCKAPSNYTYGIESVVQTDGSVSGSNLTNNEIVGLNSNYAYCVTYGDSSKTSDLVFYNVMEQHFDGTVSEWTGNLLSVNTEQMKSVESAQGTTGYCNPKVYYSVTPKSSFKSQDDLDVDDSTVWIEWEESPPADLSAVTAIAVDCRKTTTGGPFVLDRKKNLTFSINMISPNNNVSSGAVTHDEPVVKGKNYENDRSISQRTHTDITISFSDPEYVKSADPPSGTINDPESVVVNSVLKYKLAVTNPAEYSSMNDVVVEDYFDSTLKLNNTILVKVGDNTPIAADQAARISSYSTKKVVVDGVEKLKFTATISSISPGETVEITIPVTVSSKPLPDGILTNKAYITSAYGVAYTTPIETGVTYHKVTSAKAKVIKVKSNGDALPGAQLQILDKDKNPIELYYEGVAAGEGDNNDYFTSTNKAKAFDIAPGSYYLHEKKLPEGYETVAQDIPFRVDIEGIHYVKKNNVETEVSRIEMVNVPPYQVIYHSNLPTGADEIFNTVDSVDMVENKVTAFNAIPTFTGDKYYSFMGWYTQAEGGQKVTFDREYSETTHLYAQWHAYKVIFHTNDPNGSNDDEFKTFDPSQKQLNASSGINHFYDIPSFAGDEYVFAGWYHNADYAETTEGITIPVDFDKDTYLKKAADASDPDYHLYAKWIAVGTVAKQTSGAEVDANDYGIDSLRGFALAGVQIRKEELYDPNERYPGAGGEEYNDPEIKTPGGLRFVTSVSESLLTDVKGISKISSASSEAKSFGVEYGYVVGTEENLAYFIDGVGNSWDPPVKGNYTGVDRDKYRLQYNGENVNGVDTTGKNRTAETDYRYITNVNCTSKQKATSDCGVVKWDHRNFDSYRLYTLVVTYENDEDSKDSNIAARPYLRYYDANGKLRVFYNDYRNAQNVTYYGGCMCSYNQVDSIALPTD